MVTVQLAEMSQRVLQFGQVCAFTAQTAGKHRACGHPESLTCSVNRFIIEKRAVEQVKVLLYRMIRGKQEVVPVELLVSEEIDPRFLEIVEPILKNKEFLKLGGYLQHRKTSRLEHSINVSYIAWKMAKNMDCDEKLAAVAGMLHDFCVYDFKDQLPEGEMHQAFYHPKAAAWTSEEQFGIDERVRSIILTHMFPLGPMPKCREAWVVTCADKLCASLELVRIPFALSWRQRVMVVTA